MSMCLLLFYVYCNISNYTDCLFIGAVADFNVVVLVPPISYRCRRTREMVKMERNVATSPQ